MSLPISPRIQGGRGRRVLFFLFWGGSGVGVSRFWRPRCGMGGMTDGGVCRGEEVWAVDVCCCDAFFVWQGYSEWWQQ